MDELKGDDVSSALSDVRSEQTRKENFAGTDVQDGCIAGAEHLLLTCVRSLADDADAVAVHTARTKNLVIFEVTFAKNDIGKVVGRGGTNIAAVRRLLFCYGIKHKQQFRLELIE